MGNATDAFFKDNWCWLRKKIIYTNTPPSPVFYTNHLIYYTNVQVLYTNTF